MRKILSKLFTSKKKQKVEPRHFYFGIIFTRTKLTVDSNHMISLFSIRDLIYPRSEYLFTSYETAVNYIRDNFLTSGHLQPCFAYQITFRPLTEESNQLVEKTFDESLSSLYLNDFDDADILVNENILQKLVSMNIRTGIQSIEYLHICMRVGYKYFLENVVWKDFLLSCSRYQIDPYVIESASDKLGKECILNIYDRFFMTSDNWRSEFMTELITESLFK